MLSPLRGLLDKLSHRPADFIVDREPQRRVQQYRRPLTDAEERARIERLRWIFNVAVAHSTGVQPLTADPPSAVDRDWGAAVRAAVAYRRSRPEHPDADIEQLLFDARI